MSAVRRATTLHYSERVVWCAVLVGIPAWMAHLVFEASMVGFTDTHPGWDWTLHAGTVVTALATLAGTIICLDLYRRAGAARRDAPPEGRDDDASAVTLSRFLGAFGSLLGIINLALILLEGSYVILVRHGG
jgi:hypothetical protein